MLFARSAHLSHCGRYGGKTASGHKHPFNPTFDRHRQSMPTTQNLPLKTPARSAGSRFGSLQRPPAARSRSESRGDRIGRDRQLIKIVDECAAPRIGRARLQFGRDRAGHGRRARNIPSISAAVPKSPARRRLRALRLRQGGSTRPLRPTLHPIGASNSSDRIPFSERL